MRTAVSISLIICGVVVIAIPAIWHAWDSLMVAVTLTHLTQPGSSVNFGDIPIPYAFACCVLGAAMIAVSVALAFIGTHETRAPRAAAMAA